MTEPLLYRILVVLLMIAFVAHRGYYNRKYPPSEIETTDKLGSSRDSTISGIFLFWLLSPPSSISSFPT
jgi:hypothetical protein